MFKYRKQYYKQLFFEGSCIGDFKISDKSKIESFQINENSNLNNFIVSDSDAGGWLIENSIIGNINLWFSSVIDNFEVSESKTGNINIFHQSAANDFVISNSTIGEFVLSKSTIRELNVWHNSITGDFRIENSNSSRWDIDGVFGSFYFSKATIGQCKLTNCCIPKLTVQNECAVELYVSEGAINHINFEQLTLGKSSVVSFSGTNVYACNMSEFAMLGNLYFRGVKKAENVFDWHDVVTALKEKFTSEEVEENTVQHQSTQELLETHKDNYTTHTETLLAKFKKATFIISQSSLGKTEFTECDLAGFNFEYNNSKITEVFISGGTVPDNVVVYDEQNKLTKLEKLQQQKSFFDQLKKVFEGQGDIVRGTKYHARTSEIQMQIIEAERGKKNTEWLVYYLNKISNNHGESWGQAVKFIAIWSIPLYALYWLCTMQIDFNTNTAIWDWKLFGNFFGYYFSFINPTHKLEFINGADNNFGTMAFDFAGRVFIGYGIYQLISAFRKHGKKG